MKSLCRRADLGCVTLPHPPPPQPFALLLCYALDTRADHDLKDEKVDADVRKKDALAILEKNRALLVLSGAAPLSPTP